MNKNRLDHDMKKKEVQELGHGIAKIYWRHGGWSVGSIGSNSKGKRWFAASNWISGSTTKYWKYVLRVEFVDVGIDMPNTDQQKAEAEAIRTANIWSMNEKRNELKTLLICGITYDEYCKNLKSAGRTPLPVNCLMEMINEDDC